MCDPSIKALGAFFAFIAAAWRQLASNIPEGAGRSTPGKHESINQIFVIALLLVLNFEMSS